MKIDEEIIQKVISAPVGGGVSTSYVVHCTAERVVLFFGIIPQDQKDTLLSLIQEKTNGSWIIDFETAALAGAKLVIGLPESLKNFRGRLESELKKS